MRKALMPYVAAAITSPVTREVERTLHKLKRLGGRAPGTVYLKIDDPYSYLLVQFLPQLQKDISIQLRPVVLVDLPSEMYPQPELARAYALRDAPLLAARYGLHFPAKPKKSVTKPGPKQRAALLAYSTYLQGHEQKPAGEFWALAASLMGQYWNGETAPVVDASLEEMEATFAARKLDEDGHYLAATIYCDGEWYWGLDRLWHLAARFKPSMQQADYPPALPANDFDIPLKPCPVKEVELFFSFRSPYSYLILERVASICANHEVPLKIRPVLPMVMRGLAVPRTKRFYILSDAAREARRHQIPFGFVCDPLGTGVKNCLAVFPAAEKEGKGFEFILSAARAIWSAGKDTADLKNIKTIWESTGLDWKAAEIIIFDPERREKEILYTDENQDALFARGLWGVPAFTAGKYSFWGQDRLWLLEKILAQRTNAKSKGRAAK